VTGFSPTATRDDLVNTLDVPSEAVVDLQPGRNGMYAFVRLESFSNARVIKEREEETAPTLGKQRLIVEYAGNPTPTCDSPSRRVHVSGFPASATRAQLAHALGVHEELVVPPILGAKGPYAFVVL
jgi:hypothetical protein